MPSLHLNKPPCSEMLCGNSPAAAGQQQQHRGTAVQKMPLDPPTCPTHHIEVHQPFGCGLFLQLIPAMLLPERIGLCRQQCKLVTGSVMDTCWATSTPVKPWRLPKTCIYAIVSSSINVQALHAKASPKRVVFRGSNQAAAGRSTRVVARDQQKASFPDK